MKLKFHLERNQTLLSSQILPVPIGNEIIEIIRGLKICEEFQAPDPDIWNNPGGIEYQ